MDNYLKKVLSTGVVKYFLCSVFTAFIEFAILFVFKHTVKEFGSRIVIFNTTAIIISSVIHYLITSKLVFKVKWNLSSAIIYIVTFFIGLGIQDGVIWLTYNKLLVSVIPDSNLLTFICKSISLASSFFVTYFIRKFLNLKLKEKETENE